MRTDEAWPADAPDRVPKHNLVGELNAGWQVSIATLMYERVWGGTLSRSTPRSQNWTTLAKETW